MQKSVVLIGDELANRVLTALALAHIISRTPDFIALYGGLQITPVGQTPSMSEWIIYSDTENLRRQITSGRNDDSTAIDI